MQLPVSPDQACSWSPDLGRAPRSGLRWAGSGRVLALTVDLLVHGSCADSSTRKSSGAAHRRRVTRGGVAGQPTSNTSRSDLSATSFMSPSTTGRDWRQSGSWVRSRPERRQLGARGPGTAVPCALLGAHPLGHRSPRAPERQGVAVDTGPVSSRMHPGPSAVAMTTTDTAKCSRIASEALALVGGGPPFGWPPPAWLGRRISPPTPFDLDDPMAEVLPPWRMTVIWYRSFGTDTSAANLPVPPLLAESRDASWARRSSASYLGAHTIERLTDQEGSRRGPAPVMRVGPSEEAWERRAGHRPVAGRRLPDQIGARAVRRLMGAAGTQCWQLGNPGVEIALGPTKGNRAL